MCLILVKTIILLWTLHITSINCLKKIQPLTLQVEESIELLLQNVYQNFYNFKAYSLEKKGFLQYANYNSLLTWLATYELPRRTWGQVTDNKASKFTPHRHLSFTGPREIKRNQGTLLPIQHVTTKYKITIDKFYVNWI